MRWRFKWALSQRSSIRKDSRKVPASPGVSAHFRGAESTQKHTHTHTHTHTHQNPPAHTHTYVCFHHNEELQGNSALIMTLVLSTHTHTHTHIHMHTPVATPVFSPTLPPSPVQTRTQSQHTTELCNKVYELKCWALHPSSTNKTRARAQTLFTPIREQNTSGGGVTKCPDEAALIIIIIIWKVPVHQL